MMPPSSRQALDPALVAFTRHQKAPKATLPLVLVSVTVAAVSMSVDGVARFSHNAFFAAMVLSVGLAVVVGYAVDSLTNRPGRRIAVALLLPLFFGAVIGMCVQALVLGDAGDGWASAGGVRDLGGLVSTLHPATWIASGIVLGGLPAFGVSAFLLLAGRALRRFTGNDARERFGVGFVGAAGVVASFGLVVSDRLAAIPLALAAGTGFVVLLVTLLADTARMRFLRDVYAGAVTGVEIVPKERFGGDTSLVAMVSEVKNPAVLVRVDHRASYRGAAAVPLALVAAEEWEAIYPLEQRRTLTIGMMVVTSGVLSLFFGYHVFLHAWLGS
jgi:hypothetical protein